MSGLACVLWWLVLGGLLGLLGSWLIGWLLRSELPEPAVRIVEKPVDRLVEKIVEVERIVEKPVDSPSLLAQVASLGATAALVPALRSRVSELENSLASPRAAMPTPATLAALDLASAKLSGFVVKGEDDLAIIEGIGPKIAELLHRSGIKTFAELADTPTDRLRTILDAAGAKYRIADPGTWAEQADLAARNRWGALRKLQDELDGGVRVDIKGLRTEMASLKSQLNARAAPASARPERPIDLDAARAAGFNVTGADDLKIIEGIGPKIAQLLHQAGIHTFAQLADTTPAQIQPILDAAGPNFRLADPQTWAEQAALASMNLWQALQALQVVLNAGKR